MGIFTPTRHNINARGAESAVKIKNFPQRRKTLQKFPLLSKPKKSSFSINTK
jgi:hypothetical protein